MTSAKRPRSKPAGRGPNKPPRDLPGGIKNPYVRTRKPNKPPPGPMTTTLWDYPSQHYGNREQGSQRYRGATPSYIIWNVLDRYAKPHSLIVDPFCGSGTTLDVAKDLNLTARGFDIAPAREDVERADARALPLADSSVDVVFMDPPYGDILRYSDDPNCIGKLAVHDGAWGRAMAEVRDEVARVLRPGGICAVYVSDLLTKQGFFPLGIDSAAIFKSAFRLLDHVAVVRHNRKLEEGARRNAAVRGGDLQRGFHHLLLLEKRPPAKGTKSKKSGAAGGAKPKRAGGRRPPSSRDDDRPATKAEGRGFSGPPKKKTGGRKKPGGGRKKPGSKPRR